MDRTRVRVRRPGLCSSARCLWRTTNENVIRFPITGDERRRNELGDAAIPCVVSMRWLKLSERSATVGDKNLIVVDVMTLGSDQQPRKTCELVVDLSDVVSALRHVTPESD